MFRTSNRHFHEQRILSPVIGLLPNLTKRYKPVFTRLVVVKVSLRLASYQHVLPLAPSFLENLWVGLGDSFLPLFSSPPEIS